MRASEGVFREKSYELLIQIRGFKKQAVCPPAFLFHHEADDLVGNEDFLDYLLSFQ